MPDIIPGGVVIGYLSGGETRVEFTRSIGAVHAHCFNNDVPLIGQLPHISGPRIAAGRNHIVESFLNTPGEWFLMVDDDMSFEGDVIERMLKVADPKERPIVGGLAFATGRDGIFPTLFRIHPELQIPTRIDAWPLGEVVEVDATGAACLMVHRSVFERMAEEYPKPWQWFQETTLQGNTVGEDMTFCLRARALGFPIVVDTSIIFGHIKTRTIDEDEFFRWVDTHKFAIAGVDNGSTGRLAQIVTYCRVRTGHEEVWTPAGYRLNPFTRGDASWMAAPHLGTFSGYVLHVTRNPIDVVNALVDSPLFNDEISDELKPYQDVTREHSTVWGYETPIERAMAFYVEWNRKIEQHAHKRVQVESVTGDELYDLIRYAGAYHAPWEIENCIEIAPLPDSSGNLTWDDLPIGALKDALEGISKEYGYDL